jgi:hypothetical protein
MDKKLKREWVRALRSGDHKQAANVLLDTCNGGMCCLGVLGHIQGCNLVAIEDQYSVTLPRGYNAGLPRTMRSKLATMNDEGSSFEEIADFIEQNVSAS